MRSPHRFIPFGSPHRRNNCVRCGRPPTHQVHCYHHAVAVARRVYQWAAR